MQSQKLTKAPASRGVSISMIDRGREESLLLERWAAASDSARALEDADWDESADLLDMSSVAGRPRYGFES